MAIPIEQLAAAVNKQLETFANATDEIVASSVEEVAKATVQRLKETSPRRTGVYANSWRASKLKGGKHYSGRVVFAANGEYRLTHLLEHGHAKVNGGRVSPSPPGGHIEPAEQEAIASFEAAIRRGVEAIR